MWYWGALLGVVLQLAAAALIGAGLVRVCLPWRTRPLATLFLGPLVGLAVLVLAATFCGWVGHGFRQWICVAVTALLALAGWWPVRRERTLPRRLLLLVGFAGLASFPVLVVVLRFNGYSAFDDTFTYLVHGQWLQTHGFRDAVTERTYHPALSQVTLYQEHGLRMGASFFLGWLQAFYGAPWSADVYPVAAALALTCGGLAVGAAVLAACPARRTEAWLSALAASVTLNGFAYGSEFGFLPQTFGLALAAGGLALRGLELAATPRAEPLSGSPQRWLRPLPTALCLGAAVVAYSEQMPFLLCAVGLSYLLPWPGLGSAAAETWRRRAVEFARLAAWLLVLVNLEWIRSVHGILLEMGLVVGGPVAWRWWEFPAHALGLQSGVADGSVWFYQAARERWLPALVWVGFFTGGVLAARRITLRPKSERKPQISQISADRKKGVAEGRSLPLPFSEICVNLRNLRLFAGGPALPPTRWVALVPAAALAGIYAAAFVFFRYGVRSPWPQIPGAPVPLVGQTFTQFKLSNWSSLALMTLALTGLVMLGRVGRGRIGRGIVLAVLVLWCAGGLGGNFQRAPNRLNRMSQATGQRADPLEPYKSLHLALADIPATDRIYLDMPAGAAMKHRQLLSYYLLDHRLAADWQNDGYIGTWLRPDLPTPRAADCDWVVSYAQPVGNGEWHEPGGLTVTPSAKHTFALTRVDGPYGREGGGSSWWYWADTELRFQYEARGPRPRRVRVSFVYRPATEGRTLAVSINGLAGAAIPAITMTMGEHPFVTEPMDVPEGAGGKIEIGFACATPGVRAGPADARVIGFSIGNVTVEPVD